MFSGNPPQGWWSFGVCATPTSGFGGYPPSMLRSELLRDIAKHFISIRRGLRTGVSVFRRGPSPPPSIKVGSPGAFPQAEGPGAPHKTHSTQRGAVSAGGVRNCSSVDPHEAARGCLRRRTGSRQLTALRRFLVSFVMQGLVHNCRPLCAQLPERTGSLCLRRSLPGMWLQCDPRRVLRLTGSGR